VTVGGRLFHAVAAATENARSPSDDLLVAGTTSAGELDDLRRRLDSTSVGRTGSVVIDDTTAEYLRALSALT